MMQCSVCVLLLATACLAQQRQATQSSPTGERQIRLEDIERDNLAASQKAASPTTSQQATQQPTLSQQQLAAYQQQLLLQQLQQQYFAPTPVAYGNFGGVPLMIIHSNQLGLGGQAGIPIQAYFVPTEPQFLPQYQPSLYQTYQPQRYQQSQRVQTVQRVPQDLTYNSLQVQPNLQQTYRQQQNFPSSSVVYAGTPQASSFQQPQASSFQQPQASSFQQPQASSFQQPQAYQQQQTSQQQQQQLYNAYNAIYQQRQEKTSFAAGVKSTPAPPLKPQSQVYSSQQSTSPAYSNYKTFNYNQ